MGFAGKMPEVDGPRQRDKELPHFHLSSKQTFPKPTGENYRGRGWMKELKFDKVGSNLTLLTWKNPVWEVVELIPTIPAQGRLVGLFFSAK